MADVRALPGVRYDAAVVGNLADVVAPPYDVIPDEDLESYSSRSPYNVVRLTRPRSDYASAARYFEDWVNAGVLRADHASMYVHAVTYATAANGSGPQRKRRVDLLARLRLEPYDAGVVVPHEKTHRGPKEDRLQLYRATGVAFEPLWFLYDGDATPVGRLLAQAMAADPIAAFEFPAGESHRFWAVRDVDWHAAITSAFASLPVLIADGHHRYETSLAYADEVGGAIDSPSRFTLALLTDLNDPGLTVLPTHRVLKAGVKVVGGEPAGSLNETLAALHGRTAAATYRDGGFEVLPLDGDVAVQELHNQVIDNVLGKRSAEEYVLYTRDAAEAVRWVDEGRGAAAFLLDTPDLHAIFAQARSGVTMPQKSTYFYPKPPSGMVFYRLRE
jgi:uncharacterized protein (DUF1015 family)